MNENGQISPFISGKKIDLLPFTSDMITEKYLSWLNDREVNLYSRRIFGPTNDVDARSFLQSLHKDEYILALFQKETGKHIGNIQYGPINWKDSYAEIRIVIGDRSVWGRGIATEAIYLVTEYLFEILGLNRVEANSCNPGFIRCVEKLNWTIEGTLRERFSIGDRKFDYKWMSILRREFKKDSSFSP